MKVNFKKIITAIAATAMCAVPMAGSLSANAASMTESTAEISALKKESLADLNVSPLNLR